MKLFSSNRKSQALLTGVTGSMAKNLLSRLYLPQLSTIYFLANPVRIIAATERRADLTYERMQFADRVG